MPILKWLTRDEDIKQAGKAEYRLLKEDPAYSYGDKNTDNMIIHGDNLEALKALLPFYAGQVKCIYIDPPYNTGSAFEHYDDNLEHTTWLSMMYPRLELLRDLLREDGCIFIQIDDEEQAYLKVLCDEVFGRDNFINMISVNMKNIAGASGGGEDKRLKKSVEYILIYAKNYQVIEAFKPVYLYSPIYKLVEDYRDAKKSWKYTSALVDKGNKKYIASTVDGDGNEIKIYERSGYSIKSISSLMKEYSLTEKEAYKRFAHCLFQTAMPQSSIRPRVMAKVQEIGSSSELYSIEYIPKTGRNRGKVYEQFYKGESFRLFAWLKDVATEINGEICKKDLLGTYWDVVGETKNLTKEGNVVFNNGKKPEMLVSRILEMATKSGDWVLDSFLGSGTTAAVAHKMGRKYIGIELGEQATTHCQPRLKSVIDGEQSGISKAVNWKGGGGYRFYELGDTIFDENGQINSGITYEQLSAHLWFYETKKPFNKHKHKSTVLGVHKGTAYALLYNGILRDKRVDGGNVLTSKTLDVIKADLGNAEYDKLIVYGEASRLGTTRMRENNIEFKQTPYDIKVK